MSEEKTSKFDNFINGATKLFTVGEEPNDKVVKALRRFQSWLKYIFGIELMLVFIIGLPTYGAYKIKKGEVDDYVEKVISMADMLHNEQAEVESDIESEPKPLVICPHCESTNTEPSDVQGFYHCLDCLASIEIGE